MTREHEAPTQAEAADERLEIAVDRLTTGALLARELAQQLEIAERELREQVEGPPPSGEQPT